MKNPKFEIYAGKDGKFYFRLQAKNGQTILTGQGYASKSGCKSGVESVKKNAPLDERYEQKTASNGKFYFTLVAANGQVIGNSQMYTTASARDQGIEAVKSTAPDAPVEDATA